MMSSKVVRFADYYMMSFSVTYRQLEVIRLSLMVKLRDISELSRIWKYELVVTLIFHQCYGAFLWIMLHTSMVVSIIQLSTTRQTIFGLVNIEVFMTFVFGGATLKH